MKRIKIQGTSEYDVIVENGLLASAGEILRDEIGGNKAIIVSDANVAAYHMNDVAESLREAGYELSTLVLPAGEHTKDIENYSFVLNALAEYEMTGSDVIVALGGGVIGDLVGFVAATYKRGTKLVQMPTSLLAAVDSSVGGKNAINLPSAKNQVGTIRNPSIVLCDPTVLGTLPAEYIHEAYAEIIKYGILQGYEIIDALREVENVRRLTDGMGGDFSKVISMAVEIKRDIVEMDEQDASFRQYLNLGHLIGHAIEAYSDYNISHGVAVANGLALEARCCALAGLIEMSVYLEITALLEEFGFDISDTYRSEDLLPYIMRDKRIRDGGIQLIVPEHIGDCNMRQLPAERIQDLLKLI